ncbi:unnamed protein product [Schistosoma rodhaini]|uniref:UPF0506 domain-containing protein n=1 Tax=Schistosoma rodhaini TaxID=6188 RepID=A0AA85ET73_9TREM|nr:unnamed protein product [Schistosoma rodhaini]CAH8492669.1 unnamed protein product [Schistosoma rodhaini]
MIESHCSILLKWIYGSLLFVILINTIVIPTRGGIASFCSEPETVCTVFRPCCGRDWVCNRKSSATGKCVQCAHANSPCVHANDCCRGACIKGSCKLMSFFGEE